MPVPSMAGDRVTVLWITSDPPPSDLAANLDDGTLLEQVGAERLQEAIARARLRGAVVVVGSDLALDELIALGADEIVEPSPDPATVQQATRRARTRWAVREADAVATAGQELSALVLVAGAVAHELFNPLAAATANCGILQDLVLPVANVVGEMATRSQSGLPIHRSDIERLVGLVEREDLVDIREALGDLSTSLQSVRHVVHQMGALSEPDGPELCNLVTVVAEFSSLAHRNVELCAALTVDLPDQPCFVAMRRGRAAAILSALVQNAMAAVEDQGGAGNIGLRVSSEADMVVLEVDDDGAGMPPSLRRQAMNPFFTTRRPGALGLGLTFVALHVRQAGGEVLIDSEEGTGTTVRLFFPAATIAPAAHVAERD